MVRFPLCFSLGAHRYLRGLSFYTEGKDRQKIGLNDAMYLFSTVDKVS